MKGIYSDIISIRSDTVKKIIAITLSVILAVFVCYEVDRYIHPPQAKAASQFANILCDNFVPVSGTASAQYITAGNANMFIYICSYNLDSAGAVGLSIVEGTGATCGTNTKAMVGSTTAANGLTLATATTVNYGGGAGAVTKTTVPGNNVCVLLSAAVNVGGVIGWTQAPF